MAEAATRVYPLSRVGNNKLPVQARDYMNVNVGAIMETLKVRDVIQRGRT